MKAEIIELEKLLDNEIEAYSQIEQFIVDKKESLIKGDLENLRYADSNIEKFSSVINKLESKKNEITSKLGNENITLSEIISRIENEDKQQAVRLYKSKEKIGMLVKNIHRQNNINMELINHSMKLIESTVMLISNALMPEVTGYNNLGKTNKHNSNVGISSIIEEV